MEFGITVVIGLSIGLAMNPYMQVATSDSLKAATQITA